MNITRALLLNRLLWTFECCGRRECVMKYLITCRTEMSRSCVLYVGMPACLSIIRVRQLLDVMDVIGDHQGSRRLECIADYNSLV